MKELSTQFEEVQLVYYNKTKAIDRPKITCAKDAFDVFYHSWDKGQINLVEECKLMMLDNQLRVMSIASISKGGMTEAIVDPRIIFALALKRRSNMLILAHNHPSGALKPSKPDITLTRNLASIGEILRITVQDHLIITDQGFYSIQYEFEKGLSHEL
ncbi:MAG: JAB domain-containing protein [Reichenbachiella sp.]|uniref:JAB domain-containing protein n=1 Tax=Reichenbachiella sp. TaxID=2184521 RepID=UPI003297839D